VGKLIVERGPEDDEAQARLRRLLLVARFDSLLLLAIVFVMTARP
jgi:hypothetical protein